MIDNLIQGQLSLLSENLKQEVLDFIGYLLAKYRTEQESAVSIDEKINLLTYAMHDKHFLADLHEVNEDFENINFETLN